MSAPPTSNGSSRPPTSQASNKVESENTKASVITGIEGEAKKLIPINDREMTERGAFPSLVKTAFQSGMSDGQATAKVSLVNSGAGPAYSMTEAPYAELRGQADLYKSPESPFRPPSSNAPNPFVGQQAPPWSMGSGHVKW